MGVVQVMANNVLSSQPLGANEPLSFFQAKSTHEPHLGVGKELHNVVVSDVTVRLVDEVEHCPQIGLLRTQINLDVHRVIDPDFILHEKKEIF